MDEQYTGNSTGGFEADDPPERRTDAEIQSLKDTWERDGGYDEPLEDTEGFDAHYQELREWREAYKAKYRARKVASTASRAAALGFMPAQMAYFESIEQDIAHIRQDIKSLLAAVFCD